MPVHTILLTFANQSSNLLQTLQEEDDALNRLLSPRAKEQHFFLQRDSFVTLEKLPTYLTLYRDTLSLFLFSGHAGRDRLFFTDGEADSKGIAQMLGQCPNLKLVFLNGCSTQDQVRELLAKGVPVVLATSAPVDDRKATYFSTRFFEALQQQFTLREAFEMARAAMAAKYSNGPEIEIHNSFSALEGADAKPLWGLFYSLKYEHKLDWKLPVLQEPAATPPAAPLKEFVVNKEMIETLLSALAMFDGPKQLFAKEHKGERVTFPWKRMAVLNTLMAPLAEPLRRLWVPTEQDSGLDALGESRLRYLGKTYKIWMRVFITIQLSQLEKKMLNEHSYFRLIPELTEQLETYLTTKDSKDYYSIAQALYYTLENLESEHWYVDLGPLFEDADVADACFFLESIPELMARGAHYPQVKALCINAEKCFTLLISKLKFVSEACQMVSISSILVKKRKGETQYSHTAVKLHDLLGGLDQMQIDADFALDDGSVLLVNEGDWSYLNLLPLLIDDTAFYTSIDIAKLYIFSHLTENGALIYDDMYEDSRPTLEVKSGSNLDAVLESFEALYQTIFQKPLKSS